jgi:hypothetical protein
MGRRMIRVTFKEEGELNGQPVGPCKVIDTALLEAWMRDRDAETTFGPEDGVEDLGWMTLRRARREAERRGVELEEV